MQDAAAAHAGLGNRRPRKEKTSVEERAWGRGLGDIVNTQRNVWEAGSGRGRGNNRLEK